MTGTVVVLGMHRSGTSCLAGLLQEAGVDFGDVPTRSIANARGSREDGDVVRLNDDVLAYSGGSWDDPPKQLKWSMDMMSVRHEIVTRPRWLTWGFKDPRTLLTLPFWEEGLEQPRFIATVRHPFAVAKSLEKARGINYWRGLELWMAYNSALLKAQQRLGFPVVSFDLSAAAYDRAVRRAIDSIGIKPAGNVFFADRLRKHWELPKKIEEPLRGIYEELTA